VAVGGDRRKQREGDREKAEARKMLQSQQDAALNRGCQLSALCTGIKVQEDCFSLTKLCKSFFSPLM